MAYGSQQSNVQAVSDISELTHDIFIGTVVDNVRRESPVSMMFQNAGPGEYYLSGSTMHFATDLDYANGAVATAGQIPDHVGIDAVEGDITPIRRYRRIAVDNLVEKRATGPGSYEDFAERIFRQLWDSWKSMEIRHSVGPSSGLLGKCESRSSSTEFVIKDAYGHADSNPCMHISKGTILAWWDLTSTAAIDGAGIVDSVTYSTRTVTMDSATTWEPGDSLAADDLIYMASTNNISTDYFVSERNLCPNGLGTIVDPDADNSTVFGISESSYPRWKPYRKASSTFDHLEVTEHWIQLAQHRGFPVTPMTDVAVAYPSLVAQLARSLLGYQQQSQLGGTLQGGYAGIRVGNMDVVEDAFMYHDVFMTVCKENLYRVNLGGEADFWGDDGSMWARIADYDGKHAHVTEYMNTFSTHRGANSALTGITTDVTDADYSSVPDY